MLTEMQSSSVPDPDIARLKAAIPLDEGFSHMPQDSQKSRISLGDNGILAGRQLLEALKIDLINDISGDGAPLSSLCYPWVTTRFMGLFCGIEHE